MRIKYVVSVVSLEERGRKLKSFEFWSSCNTRGLNISTHASITTFMVFTSYHIYRKNCSKIQNSFENITEYLFHHSKSKFLKYIFYLLI